jgi:HK97 gp10 family phage protein
MEALIQLDKKSLLKITKDLDQLFPDSDTKLRNTLRSAMRKAAKPLVPEIRGLIDAGLSSDKSTGQLKKSIAIINGKTNAKRKPSVYVGPRVKKSWASKEKSGFYFYFLEYGKAGVPARRMLDKAAQAKGNQVMNDTINQLKQIIAKRWAKKLG